MYPEVILCLYILYNPSNNVLRVPMLIGHLCKVIAYLCTVPLSSARIYQLIRI